MVRSLAAAAIVVNGQKGLFLVQGEPAVLRAGVSRFGVTRSPFPGRCLGDQKRVSGLARRAFGARARATGVSLDGQPCSQARASSLSRAEGVPSPAVGIRFLSLNGSRCRAVEGRGETGKLEGVESVHRFSDTWGMEKAAVFQATVTPLFYSGVVSPILFSRFRFHFPHSLPLVIRVHGGCTIT